MTLPALLLPALLLIAAAIVIYLSCEWFVNGVEWVGAKLSLGQRATGTVLAAFGTALPESVVTLVAVAFGSGEGKQLGVGAALGGPLALATIAYATVGIVLLLTGRRLVASAAMTADIRHLARDQGWFLLLFAAKVALGLVLFGGKAWCGLLFLAAYAAYVLVQVRDDDTHGEEEGGAEPLKLRPRDPDPSLALALVQTLGALVAIFVASRLFVGQLGTIGPLLGMKPQLVALLLSPIATELPETLNAVIWVRQGKQRLALANISGAMMIQATIPTALGLFFTPWLLDRALLIGAGMTAAAILTMFLSFRAGKLSRRLLAGMAGFYAGFVALLVAG